MILSNVLKQENFETILGTLEHVYYIQGRIEDFSTALRSQNREVTATTSQESIHKVSHSGCFQHLKFLEGSVSFEDIDREISDLRGASIEQAKSIFRSRRSRLDNATLRCGSLQPRYSHFTT